MSHLQLIFVYNSDSGLFSTLADFAHKIFSPSTYQCQLCALTYGNFLMKREWREFIKELPVDITFYYKDDFLESFNMGTAFPAIYIRNLDVVRLFLSRKEIANCASLDELKDLINEKLAIYDQRHHTDIQ